MMPVETRQARPIAVTRRDGRRFRPGEDGGVPPGVDLHARRLLRRQVPRRGLGRGAAQYAPRIAGAQTPDEMRRLLNLMVGELNASHMGVARGGGGAERESGTLVGPPRSAVRSRGVRSDGRFKVTEVIPLGPAAVTRQVNVGDYMSRSTADGQWVARTSTKCCMHTVGRRVALTRRRRRRRATGAKVAGAAREHGDREEPALSRVGGVEPRATWTRRAAAGSAMRT